MAELFGVREMKLDLGISPTKHINFETKHFRTVPFNFPQNKQYRLEIPYANTL